MFDLQKQDIFIVKACEWELGSVRHDLDYVPCDEWHVRNPSALRTRGTPVECAESTDSSYAKQVPPPHFPWCNCSWTRKSRGLCETRYSTWWLPPKYMMNGFLCVFHRSLFRWTNAWVCHPHREVNISISVFVAAVEVTTKCSMQLHTLDQQPTDGRYLLPLLCDPWIYANLDSCAYTCSWTYMYARICVCSHLYKLKIQYIWKHMLGCFL